MKKTNLINQAVIATVLSTTGMMAWAQSSVSMFIPLNAKSYEKMAGEDMARVNLINEAKKLNPALKSVPNLEVQMIRVEAKAGVGGAQVFLRINNEMMDSQAIETDPDQLESLDERSFKKVELKNIDRSLVNEASLVIQAFSNTRIRSLELVMGPVQEPVIFGRYADDQIAQIGGSVTSTETEGNIEAVRPSAEVVNAIYNRYYYQSATGLAMDAAVSTATAAPVAQPTVPQPAFQPTCPPGYDLITNGRDFNCLKQQVVVQAPTPVAQPVVAAPAQPVRPAVPVKQCVNHKKRYQICVGDNVKNSWGFPGVVRSVNTRTNEVTAFFEFRDDLVTRDVDSFSK